MLDRLPLEVVEACASRLGDADVARLALCSRWLRDAMLGVLSRRGLTVADRHADCIFKNGAWAALQSLTIRGIARKFFHGPYVHISPPAIPFASLRSLVLTHCHLPPDRKFWPCVFEACPALEAVSSTTDFHSPTYASDVSHHVDLLTLGVPRLRRLDVEGVWMLVYPINAVTSGREDIFGAVTAAHAVGAVASSTLEFFRLACQQVPVSVDSSALRHAVVVEPHQKPLVVSRMGPASHAALRRLDWRVPWQAFDAAALAPFRALTDLTIRLEASSASRVSRALATLAHVPPTVKHLRLVLDTWLMSWDDSGVEWGAPLQHLTALQSLDVEMKFCPSTAATLLAGWMGAGAAAGGAAAIRRVRVAFLETLDHEFQHEVDRLIEEHGEHADDSVDQVRQEWRHATRPLDPAPLARWLDDRPDCVALIHNGPAFAPLAAASAPPAPPAPAPLANVTNITNLATPARPHPAAKPARRCSPWPENRHEHPRVISTRTAYF